MTAESGEWISVDGGNVLSETIDQEVMIIDMRLGNYFSLSGVAATIWNALTTPRQVEDLVACVRQHHPGAPADLDDVVRGFIRDLAAEQLVVTQSAAPEPWPAPFVPDPALPTSPFQPPKLEKYTDMQALLLVDPIHDVDVLGWPTRERPS